MRYNGVLIQNEFRSARLTVDLHVVNVRRGVRGAKGRMQASRDVLTRLLDPACSPMFEFEDESGQRFNLFAERADLLSGLCEVSSSGRVPGLLE